MTESEPNTISKSEMPKSPFLWKVGIFFWACSPASLMFGFVLMYGTNGSYLRWVAFLGGVMNLYVLSAYLVQRKGVEDWYVRAIPITLGFLVANMVVFLLLSLVLGLPVGMKVQP